MAILTIFYNFGKAPLLAFMATVCFMANAQAKQVTLIWDPSNDPQIVAYRLYYGTVSRSYDQQLDIGVATTAIVSNLADGITYFFVVTAFTAQGVESQPSNEVSDELSPPFDPTPTPMPGPTPPSPFPPAFQHHRLRERA